MAPKRNPKKSSKKNNKQSESKLNPFNFPDQKMPDQSSELSGNVPNLMLSAPQGPMEEGALSERAEQQPANPPQEPALQNDNPPDKAIRGSDRFVYDSAGMIVGLRSRDDEGQGTGGMVEKADDRDAAPTVEEEEKEDPGEVAQTHLVEANREVQQKSQQEQEKQPEQENQPAKEDRPSADKLNAAVRQASFS